MEDIESSEIQDSGRFTNHSTGHGHVSIAGSTELRQNLEEPKTIPPFFHKLEPNPCFEHLGKESTPSKLDLTISNKSDYPVPPNTTRGGGVHSIEHWVESALSQEQQLAGTEQGEMADNLESEYNLGCREPDMREESRLKSIQLTDSGPVVWTINPEELSKELPRETLENHTEVHCSVQDNART